MATPKLLTYNKKIKSDKHGTVWVTNIQNIRPYSMVNMEFINWPKQSYKLKFEVVMGKLSGWTLGQRVGTFAPAARIRSYRVVGPELNLWIKGAPPNKDVNVQGWVFLH